MQRLHQKEAALRLVSSLQPRLREAGVVSAALFGSVLHGRARPGSDIDLLIEIAPNRRFTLLDLVGVKLLLEERLGRPVDLVTRTGIDPLLKAQVLAEAERAF